MSPGHKDQLPLAVGLEDEATFDNFVVSPDNLQPVTWLKEPDRLDSPLLIWGPPASGRTHLLQACCHLTGSRGAFFLPLRRKERLRPEILDGLGNLSIVCIDDVHCAAGDPDWERALVRLINAMSPAGSRLLLSASAPAAKISWRLADLRSRCSRRWPSACIHSTNRGFGKLLCCGPAIAA